MPANVASLEEDLWSDRVSARHTDQVCTTRHFNAQRINLSNQEKFATRARYSRAVRSSAVAGGISRRGTRRSNW
jgi:hypothetical protein